jgi:methanogenic corrinoid protein MtbC1
VVREHVATAISEQLLGEVVAAAVPAITRHSPVVVACAEGDWHVLPARMLAELLRLDGWPVTFTGAATPAEHLEVFLAEHRPAAVGLACSMPHLLPALRRAVRAAGAAGVPALVGGLGCGPDDRWARRLGARWARDAEGFGRALISLEDAGPPPDRPPARVGTARWQKARDPRRAHHG